MHVGRLFPAHMKFLNRFVHTSYFLSKKKDLKVFNAKDLLGISLFYTLIKNNKKMLNNPCVFKIQVCGFTDQCSGKIFPKRFIKLKSITLHKFL